MLALDRSGRVVLDSGPMGDLDPGGAVFGPDGRFYVTMRRRRTILGISATLDGQAEPLLPEDIVPFPRGFDFGLDGSLYLASGIGPSGDGDNAILVFDLDAPGQSRRMVTDPELSPLDLTVVPDGDIVIASESPFRAPDAVVAAREYRSWSQFRIRRTRRFYFPLLRIRYSKGMPKVSTKNQVTLPVEVMRGAGLRPGDEVAIEALGEGEIRIAARGSRVRHNAGIASGIYGGRELDRLRDEWER
jgi:bifunctional DNA-binding transcriptional regulator/antitoxin component of YhaV-PrlF toxin-antitoxin module